MWPNGHAARHLEEHLVAKTRREQNRPWNLLVSIQTTELSTIIQTWLIPGLIIFILPKLPSFKTLNIFKSSPAIAAPRHVEASLRPLSEVQRLDGLPFQGTQHRQVPNPSRESLLLPLHGAWDPWVWPMEDPWVSPMDGIGCDWMFYPLEVLGM